MRAEEKGSELSVWSDGENERNWESNLPSDQLAEGKFAVAHHGSTDIKRSGGGGEELHDVCPGQGLWRGVFHGQFLNMDGVVGDEAGLEQRQSTGWWCEGVL